MFLDELATELLFNIFICCRSVKDVVALSATAHRFRGIYKSSRRLVILEQAAETQYGPLADVIQLVTHNASQPVHLAQSARPAFSQSLLLQIVRTGQVAERWADIYPMKKWKINFEERRMLRADERRRLRAALYRLWLYSRAFHNRHFPREMRMRKDVVVRQAALVRQWSMPELADIADVHMVVRDVVSANICPSDETVLRRVRKRFPGPEEAHHQLLSNIHLNHPPASLAPHLSNSNWMSNNYHSHSYRQQQSQQEHFTGVEKSRYVYAKYVPSRQHDPGFEGWGDDIQHYYVVQDMLKLDPEQILFLKERAPLKHHVDGFVRGIVSDGPDGGAWFANNGETWPETLEHVLAGRGEDVAAFFKAITGRQMGIAMDGREQSLTRGNSC